MSLELTKSETYANPYYTNWGYLYNMTSLQVKALEGMKWYEGDKYIDTSLWSVPWISFSMEDVKYSMELFIDNLDKELRRL
jgi:hypothetical protein